MANFDFFIYKNSEKEELLILDYSSNTTYKDNITTWNLEVLPPNVNTVLTFDIIDYIYNYRQLNELYSILPETINQEEKFTDGLYTITINTNNSNLIKTHYIILYSNINSKFKSLLKKYNYKFEVSDVGYINWIDDSSEHYTEEIRILSGLINQLETYSFTGYSSTVENEINDILDKANRICEILEDN